MLAYHMFCFSMAQYKNLETCYYRDVGKSQRRARARWDVCVSAVMLLFWRKNTFFNDLNISVIRNFVIGNTKQSLSILV